MRLSRTDISIIDCAVCIVIYDDTTEQHIQQDSVDLTCAYPPKLSNSVDTFK